MRDSVWERRRCKVLEVLKPKLSGPGNLDGRCSGLIRGQGGSTVLKTGFPLLIVKIRTN